MKIINVDKKSFKILYFDIVETVKETTKNDDLCGKKISVLPASKNIDLTEGIVSDAHIATYLDINVDVTFERSILITSTALNRLLHAASLMIASEGRISTANTVMCNKKTSHLLSDVEQFKVYINDYVNDNELYVLTIEDTIIKDAIHPGYYIFKYIDENKIKYENIVAVGFFPQKQVARIKLS